MCAKSSGSVLVSGIPDEFGTIVSTRMPRTPRSLASDRFIPVESAKIRKFQMVLEWALEYNPIIDIQTDNCRRCGRIECISHATIHSSCMGHIDNCASQITRIWCIACHYRCAISNDINGSKHICLIKVITIFILVSTPFRIVKPNDWNKPTKLTTSERKTRSQTYAQNGLEIL